MNTTRTFPFIAFFCLATSAFAEENTDALKQRILAQAKSMAADDYAFTRTLRTNQSSNGKTEQKVTVERFDPTKTGDARWTLVSVNGSTPPADELARFQKDSAKRRVPGYYRLATYFGSPATASTDSHGRTVFRFASLPKGSVIVLDSDVWQNATAEVAVIESNGIPLAESVYVSVKPTRIKLVARLDRFESTTRYRLGSDGKPLLVEQTLDLSGSGMGQEGKAHTVVTYSDYRAVRATR